MVDPVPMPDLGPIALTAARAGAAAIRLVIGTGQLGTRFKSGGHDMVTAADKASERAVIDAIRTARPADSILGEEGGAHQGTTDVRWLVDPLDGTANFVYGRADYAVSVGAELAGEPSAGSIIRPADGQWVTSRGERRPRYSADIRSNRSHPRGPAVQRHRRPCGVRPPILAFGTTSGTGHRRGIGAPIAGS